MLVYDQKYLVIGIGLCWFMILFIDYSTGQWDVDPKVPLLFLKSVDFSSTFMSRAWSC